MVHRWSERDDAAALYLYKFGRTAAAPDVKDAARRLGMSDASLRMRIQNFRAIDTGAGLGHFAQQSSSVHRRCGALAEPELRRLAGW